jgi:hypothetical protein
MDNKQMIRWGLIIGVIIIVYMFYKKQQSAAAATALAQPQTFYADGTPVIPGLTQAQNEGN